LLLFQKPGEQIADFSVIVDDKNVRDSFHGL
jgi:hypothetical protein